MTSRRPHGLPSKNIEKAKELNKKLWRLDNTRTLTIGELAGTRILAGKSLFKELTLPKDVFRDSLRQELNETNGFHPLIEFEASQVNTFLEDVARVAIETSEEFFNPWTIEQLTEIKKASRRLLSILPKKDSELVLLGRRTGDPVFFVELAQNLEIVRKKISTIKTHGTAKRKGVQKEFRSRNQIKKEIEKSILKHFGKRVKQANALMKALMKTSTISSLGNYSRDSIKESFFKK